MIAFPQGRNVVRALLNASITTKMMAVLALVAILFLGTLALVYLPTFENELLQDRKTSLMQLVDVAHSLLTEYHQRVGSGELSLAEAQSRAILRIGNLRYGKNDYFWICETNLPFPRIIRHPILAELQGKDSNDEQFGHASKMEYGTGHRVVIFPKGDKNLAQAFAEISIESGGGFVSYSWPRPTPHGATTERFPKESYVRLFAPWGWVIGTGAYVDDIQTRLSHLRWSIFSATIAILFAAILLLTLFIGSFVTHPMRALMRYAEEVSAGNWSPVVHGRFYAETARLKSVITQMVGELQSAVRQAEDRQYAFQKEAEKARLLTDKLDALFKSMTELVVLYELVFDESGHPVDYRITGCNRAFEESVGRRKADLLGQRATEFYATPSPPHLEGYARVAMGGEPYAFETYDERKNRHFIISVASHGKNEFVTVATDITKRKQTEQLIAEKNKELEQIIYAASHDLRAPLVNIDGYGKELELTAQSIQLALQPDTPSPASHNQILRSIPDMLDALHHVRNSTRQMDALIKGLLSLSRSGRSPLTVEPLDMDVLLSKVASSLGHPAKEVGATLHMAPLPPCYGDAIQVTRVFENLVGNAIKYLDPSRPGHITVSGSSENNRCIYCIADNGIGIAPEHRERIFDLFHRLNPSATEGDGLGLAIVRQILGRLDGKVWLESTLGVGSRFFVSLPATPPPPENAV